MRQRLAIILLVLVLGALGAACAGNDDPSIEPPAGSTPTTMNPDMPGMKM